MSRSVRPTNYRRDPMPLSEVLAETFRHTGQPEDLTAWVDGQETLFYLDSDSVHIVETPKSPVRGLDSTARPGADWGTWDMPC